MDERKILLFILAAVIYCLYSVHMWFMKESVNETIIENQATVQPMVSSSAIELQLQAAVIKNNDTQEIKREIKSKIIPLYFKNACSILEVFTEKPPVKFVKAKAKQEDIDSGNNAITVIGITAFLVILALNAVLDVIKVKEEERARMKLNPDGVRRQSLSEFANKKTLRRESSRFGFNLFQILESNNSDEEKKTRRQSRNITRGDSTNSYLSDRKPQMEGSAPASIGETATGEPKLVKRQSVAKLFGARPVPMVRRSSFPALPLNPDVQALMLGHRQPSVDSDDESDGRGRRVRIIRRY